MKCMQNEGASGYVDENNEKRIHLLRAVWI